MSGHSKWASIKRSKAANDAKRGKIFTRIGHEIAIAVGEGGPDPDANFNLRVVLDKARGANMPKSNIERAIKRGSGELKGTADLVESLYQGYGPHGTAIMVHVLSDNKNRAVSGVRHGFSRHGGNLGSEGCVAWMFSRKGYVAVDPGDQDPEGIALLAIDAGAEDVETGGGIVEVYTRVEDFKGVQEVLSEYGASREATASEGDATPFRIVSAQLSWIPQTTMELGERETLQTMKLLESLEDLDDVQEVFSNLDISDDVIAKYEAARSLSRDAA